MLKILWVTILFRDLVFERDNDQASPDAGILSDDARQVLGHHDDFEGDGYVKGVTVFLLSDNGIFTRKAFDAPFGEDLIAVTLTDNNKPFPEERGEVVTG